MQDWPDDRPPATALGWRAPAAVSLGAALFWVWVPLADLAFAGNARSMIPVHLLVGVLAAVGALVLGRPIRQSRRTLAGIVLGFVAMGIVAALVWYGYVLPEACDDLMDEWERRPPPGNGTAPFSPHLSC